MANALTKWYERTIAKHGSMRTAAKHQGKHAVVHSVSSLAAGAILGYAHAELKNGLDIRPTATSTHGIPADAAVGVLGMMTGSDTLQASGFSVFGFRKTLDVIAAKRAAMSPPGPPPNGTVGVARPGGAMFFGDMGEDPILAAARAL